jgi:hypothetical protein
VLTPDTLPDGDFVFFAVTPEGYETMSLNEAEKLRWINDILVRVKYYEGDSDE